MLKTLGIGATITIAAGLWGATAQADTVTLAIGEWEPHIGKNLEGYGPHSKIVAETFEKAGFELKYEFMPWKRAYEKVKDGTFPITYTWSGTEDRRKEVLVPTRPLMESKTAAYYLKEKFPDGLTISSYADIGKLGLKGISVSGYSAEEYFTKAGVDYMNVSNEAAAWRVLAKQRGDIYTSDQKAVAKGATEGIGPNYSDIIGSAGVVDIVQMFPLFSRKHPDGSRLMAIWDAGAN